MLSIILIFTLASSALARSQFNIVFAREGFIVNGEDADIASHPHQGSLRTSGDSHTCGCALIDPDWAITAAHCVGGSGYSTRWGNTNHNDGTQVDVDSVAIHPEYEQGPGAYPNDIAVLGLASSASGDNISPISMGSSRVDSAPAGTITGWGRTCGSCAIPNTLQELDIPVITDAECTAAWGGNYSPEAHICVFGSDGGACNGDSGGPLVVGGELHGLASWVASGCLSTFPSSYARVSSYRDWVCGETGNAGC